MYPRFLLLYIHSFSTAFTTQVKRIIFPSHFLLQRARCGSPLVCAALTRGRSDSSATRSRPQRPPLRSFAPHRSVPDRFFCPPSAQHLQSSVQPAVCVSEGAPLARGLSDSNLTCLRARRPCIRDLAPRGGPRDCLRCFTPPRVCKTPRIVEKVPTALQLPGSTAQRVIITAGLWPILRNNCLHLGKSVL